MQIFHRNEEGERAAVSIFLDIDNAQSINGDRYINKFILETWPIRSKHEIEYERCLDAKPILTDVLLNHYFSPSFFTY